MIQIVALLPMRDERWEMRDERWGMWFFHQLVCEGGTHMTQHKATHKETKLL